VPLPVIKQNETIEETKPFYFKQSHSLNNSAPFFESPLPNEIYFNLQNSEQQKFVYLSPIALDDDL
jgi:hypothetical protein